MGTRSAPKDQRAVPCRRLWTREPRTGRGEHSTRHPADDRTGTRRTARSDTSGPRRPISKMISVLGHRWTARHRQIHARALLVSGEGRVALLGIVATDTRG